MRGLGMWKIQLEAVPSLTLEHLRKVEADAPRTGSLVIYDDVDRITDDKMNKAVQKLISDILSHQWKRPCNTEGHSRHRHHHHHHKPRGE